VLAAIWMGARFSGVGVGLWGAVGLLVLIVAFGVNYTRPSPISFFFKGHFSSDPLLLRQQV
jgi:anaerobic C4-dicarboxylate transporter